MKTNLKMGNIRGSIFVPRVAYTPDNLDKMRDAFKDYMPTALPQVAMPDFLPGYLAMNKNAWRMVSPDQKETISFYDDKIDIIVNAEAIPYTEEEIKKWGKHFFDSFKKIIDAFQFSSIRLALAPTLYLPFTEGSPFTINDFTNRIFAFNKFQGSGVDNCDFSQVFRVNKQLNGKDYLMNLLSRFSTEQYQEQKENTIHTGIRLIVNVDINTFMNPQYVFAENEMHDFYDLSPKWCEELMCSYFPKSE